MTLLSAWSALADATGLSLLIADPLLSLLVVAAAFYAAAPFLHKALQDALPPEPHSSGHRSSSSRSGSSSRSRERSERERHHHRNSAEKSSRSGGDSSGVGGVPKEGGGVLKSPSASRHSSSGRAALEAAARDALRVRASHATALLRGDAPALGPHGELLNAKPPSHAQAAVRDSNGGDSVLPAVLPESPGSAARRTAWRPDSPESFSFSALPVAPRSGTPDPLVRSIPGSSWSPPRNARRTVAFSEVETIHVLPPPITLEALMVDPPAVVVSPPKVQSPPSRSGSKASSSSSPPTSLQRWQLVSPPPDMPPAPPAPAPAMSWEDELRAELAAEEAAAAAAAAAAAEAAARQEKSDMVLRLIAQAEALAAQQRADAIAEREAALEAERQAVAAAIAAAEATQAELEAATTSVDDGASALDAEYMDDLDEDGFESVAADAAGVPPEVDDAASTTTDEGELALLTEAHLRAEAIRAAEAAIEQEVATAAAQLTARVMAAVIAQHERDAAQAQTAAGSAPQPPAPARVEEATPTPSPQTSSRASSAQRAEQGGARGSSPSLGRPPLAHHTPSALLRRRRNMHGSDDDESQQQVAAASPAPQMTPAESTGSMGQPPKRVDSPSAELATAASSPAPHSSPIPAFATPRSEGSVTSASQSRAASLTELAALAEAADLHQQQHSPYASPAGTPPPSPRHHSAMMAGATSRSVSRASSAGDGDRKSIRDGSGGGAPLPQPPQERRLSGSPANSWRSGDDGSALMTPEEADALSQLKIVMSASQPRSDADRRFCTDACLARYLRASRWDVSTAAKNVSATIAWRQALSVDALTWEQVAPGLGGAPLPVFSLGLRDRHGRPVLVLRPAAVTSLADDAVVRLLQHTMEVICHSIDTTPQQSVHAPRGSRADLSSEQLLLVVDGTDWRVMVPGGRTALRRCLKLLTRHYPERLGAALVLHPPRLFSTMWAVVSAFLDARTTAKVQVVSTDIFKQRELLAVHFANLGELDAALGGDRSDAPFDLAAYAQLMRSTDATRTTSHRIPAAPVAIMPADTSDEDTQEEDEADESTASRHALDSEVAAITSKPAHRSRRRPEAASTASRVNHAAAAAAAREAMERVKARSRGAAVESEQVASN